MTRRFARLAAGAALLTASAAAAAGSHVFLVQNSGWMEPFYTDPASPFKPLVAEIVMAATRAGDPMVLAAFNQGVPGAPSPRALLSLKVDPVATRREVVKALAALDVARKPGSTALADTDLNEAVDSAIGTALGGKPGLVWLVTNNRNSPNNDQATALRNRDFYRLIHRGDAIGKALAFPLQMPVQGAQYRANGLMLYVFAVGEQGARELDALLASGRLQRVVTEPPARLKPLDRDTVRLLPRKVSDAPGVSFSMTPGGVLHADVDADTRAPTARIEWNLENAMYPYTIASATIGARSVLGGEDRPIELASTEVRKLAPGTGAPLASVMQLPVRQLPGKWSIEAITSAGSAYVLPGRIELQLSGQQLELSQAFRQRMATLFPGDPLPDIFTPPAQVKGSTAVLPIEVRVHYGVGPLVAAIGAALALLGAAAAAMLAMARPRKAYVTVEDELRTMHARAGTVQPIYDKAGNKVAQLKTTLFGHQLIDLREGAQVRLGR
ncbi:hypothetical protein HF313_28060 [Massilia atriviolacea]|uniref:VWA domain-containing protein n=1 Tax=Massilia atriviolacea TaxID=2495579 RepID=A0A430HJS3_9BURK|nr:hypothetical protein [Massilia atriviolacea]RSZ57750.1 hypothetical protein EJB06_18915 [Massilia atriviolacea]